MSFEYIAILNMSIIFLAIIHTRQILLTELTEVSVCFFIYVFFFQKNNGLPVATRVHNSSQWVFLMFVGVACVGGLLVGSLTIACLRSHAQQLASRKLGLGPEAGSATHYAYQVSCNLFLRHTERRYSLQSGT